MTTLLKHFLNDESGQGITEYGAVLSFIAVLAGVVLVLINSSLKTSINQAFSLVGSQLSNLMANSAS